RMEYLHRLVGVERRHDLRDRVEVPIEELAEPMVVVDRACARAAADEKLEARDAERVLDVNSDEADPRRVFGRLLQRLFARPLLRLPRALFVRDAPDLADPRRLEVRGNREHAA